MDSVRCSFEEMNDMIEYKSDTDYAPVSLAYISMTGICTFLNLGIEKRKMFEFGALVCICWITMTTISHL